MEGFYLTLIVLIALGIYFMPLIIAASRKHKNTSAIAVINLFLGWLLIPWVAALAWSLCHQEPTKSA